MLSSRFSAWLVFWPLSLMAACTTPHYDVRSTGSDRSGPPPLVRLHDVAFPLLVAAADWCVLDKEPTYGFLVTEMEPSEKQAEVEGSSRVAVVYVHPRSPAASAGLMPGDQLIRVNERAVARISSEDVAQSIRKMTVARIQPLQLDVLRDGHQRRLNLWPIPACNFLVQLIENDRINGIADGKRIAVTTGAIRFVRSDDELAWVVAHEIAHNVLNHSQDARLHAMLQTFLKATTGSSAETPGMPRDSLEVGADYVGAYIMARAGYDLRAIEQFWRRMEDFHSGQNNSETDRSHPTNADRLSAFQVTLKEIEGKRQRGESLQPASIEP